MTTITTVNDDQLINRLMGLLDTSVTKHMADPNITDLPRQNSRTDASTNQVTLAPPNSNMSLLKLLQTLQVKMDEEGMKESKEEVRVHSEVVKIRQAEAQEATQKAIAEMEKSKKSGVFAQIFGWIASAVALVAGALMIATGVGAVAGGIMMALAVDQMIGMATGKSLIGEATKGLANLMVEMGMDETAAQVVATVAMMVVLIAVTWGASTSSAANMASNTAQKMSQQFARSFPESAKAMSQASQKLAANLPSSLTASRSLETSTKLAYVRDGATVVTGATQVSGQAAGIDSAVHKHAADEAQVEELRIRKFILQEQAAMEHAIEELKRLVEHSEGVMTQIINNLNQTDNTMKTLIKDTA